MISSQPEKSVSQDNMKAVLVTWFFTFVLFFFCGSLFSKFSNEQVLITQDKLNIPVFPTARPEITQESIDIAMKQFRIALPRHVVSPKLDRNVKDRGITIRTLVSEKAVVRIGPEAFGSWALLGSTLAHEIEVHCIQDYMSILLMDSLGLDGRTYAELQAYDYELANASRFGLSMYEIDYIFQIKNEYAINNNKLSMVKLSKYGPLSESFFTAFFSRK